MPRDIFMRLIELTSGNDHCDSHHEDETCEVRIRQVPLL